MIFLMILLPLISLSISVESHMLIVRFLMSNQLTGTIPPQLGNLKQMIFLCVPNRIVLTPLMIFVVSDESFLSIINRVVLLLISHLLIVAFQLPLLQSACWHYYT